jgi:nucleoside-triphosphatase THEP1
MVIIITGELGAGKTTICQKLVKLITDKGYKCNGVISYKNSDTNIIIEDIQSGNKEILASKTFVYDGPRTKGYSFNPAGIDFGIKSIEKGIGTDVLIIDEIGYLERDGEGFVNGIDMIKKTRNESIIVVIRSILLPFFQDQLGDIKPLIFRVTPDNRDSLPEEIALRLIRHST